MPYKPTPLADRFWEKVNKTEGCWLWTASTTDGYGRIYDLSKLDKVYAHRVSWELHFGPIPDGLFVLHKCDNRLCVRPDHLFLGTQADNLEDMTKKDRRIRGETHPNALLTEANVRQIRKLFEKGETQVAIAQRFGVSDSTIRKIVKRRKWKHVR